MSDIRAENDGIVVLTLQGKLSQDDFAKLSAAVDPIIARDGRLRGLVIHTAIFPGWQDLHGLHAHLAFVCGHQRNIRKLALVTDSCLAGLIEPLGNLLLQPDIRHFAFAEPAQALLWIRAD